MSSPTTSSPSPSSPPPAADAVEPLPPEALVYRAAVGDSSFWGTYDIKKDSHFLPDLYVFRDSSGYECVQASRADRRHHPRGISFSTDLRRLKRLFRAVGGVRYHQLRAEWLQDGVVQLLQEGPRGKEHYVLSPCEDLPRAEFDAHLQQIQQHAAVVGPDAAADVSDDDVSFFTRFPFTRFQEQAVLALASAIAEAAATGDMAHCLELDYQLKQYRDDPTYHVHIAEHASVQTRYWLLAALRSNVASLIQLLQQGVDVDPHCGVLVADGAEMLVAVPLLRIVHQSQLFDGAEGLTMDELSDAFMDDDQEMELKNLRRADWLRQQGTRFDSLSAFVRALLEEDSADGIEASEDEEDEEDEDD